MTQPGFRSVALPPTSIFLVCALEWSIVCLRIGDIRCRGFTTDRTLLFIGQVWLSALPFFIILRFISHAQLRFFFLSSHYLKTKIFKTACTITWWSRYQSLLTSMKKRTKSEQGPFTKRPGKLAPIIIFRLYLIVDMKCNPRDSKLWA